MRDGGGTRALLAMGFAVGALACRASVKGTATVNASEVQVDDDRKWEIAEPPSAPQATYAAAAPTTPPRVAAAVTVEASSDSVPFLGVARDLSLSAGSPHEAVCRCLAVAYGAPNDAKFTWQAGPPAAQRDTIAIAIATDGVACPSGSPPVRASISAVEREGSDIVLVVENVGVGRPIMRGALALWPGPNGAIDVRTGHGTPYPAASGPEPCRLALK